MTHTMQCSSPPRFRVKKSVLAISGALFSVAVGVDAQSQESTQAADERTPMQLEEVVVTGTLIRGAEVVGSQAINLDSEDITEVGAMTTNEFLASVPQVTNTFNQRPDTSPRNPAGNTVNRPNLRGLPGFTGASGSTTLVLVDGHRGAPLGLIESSFDPDMIAPGVIERVEIVTDGGSSLYGADAIGGVINFITRKEFDGVKLDIDYGNGDDFDEYTIGLTAGTSWDSGSGYFSYSDSSRDNIERGDRDWAMLGNYQPDGSLQPNGTECLVPAGSEQRWFWYGSGWTNNPLAPGTGVFPVGEPCDVAGAGSLMPKKELRNLFASFNQQLTDGIEMSVKTYYGERDLTYSYYPLGDTISGPTPADLGLVGGSVGDLYAQPSLGFSYGVHPAYQHREQETQMSSWGITPEFTFDLPGGWQLRNTNYYGKSITSYVEPDSNFLKASQYVADGLLDPANVATASNEVINDILDWESAGKTVQELYIVRAIADGALFELPAGELRAAIGAEYNKDKARQRNGLSGVVQNGLGNVEYREGDRDVTSLFAELSVPIFSTLDLSVSVRHDDYSDFGETTNPSVGLNFLPVDWIKIYGHYGESFNAPTVLDSLAVARSRNTPMQWSSADPNHEYVTDAEAADPSAPEFGRMPGNLGTMQLLGAGGALEPQTAETWAVGFEINPPVLDGFSFRANYWEIDFLDALGAVNPQIDQAVLSNPDKFIFNPTQEEYEEYLTFIDNPDETRAFYATLNPDGLPGVILDRRTANVDEYQLRGVDFGINFALDSGFGLFVAGVSGVKYLESTAIEAGGDTDLLESNTSDLAVSGNIGWSGQNIRSRITLNYTDGYDITGAATDQTSVDGYLVTDFFAAYDFDGSDGFTNGLSLRFYVNNVFDEDPPVIERNNFPPDTFTMGRVFKVGLSKTFD